MAEKERGTENPLSGGGRLIESLKTTAEQILSRLAAVRGRGEESTKNAMVLPMISALGYDVWNPTEVHPEYEADFAIKKAGQKEKVDYCLLIDGKPRVYIEAKAVEVPLDGHEGQLARYFNATSSVDLGILTNGIEWRFYSDTVELNKIDPTPFYVIRFDSVDQGLDVISKFSRQVISSIDVRSLATELRYTTSIAAFLRSQIDIKDREPDEYMMRWILKGEVSDSVIYSGVVNANVLDRFQPIIKTAMNRVLREIAFRMVAAMDAGFSQLETSVTQPEPPPPLQSTVPTKLSLERSPRIQRDIAPIEEELTLLAKVKEICLKCQCSNTIFDPSTRKMEPIDIQGKAASSYFSIYINKTSWWFLRVYLRSPKLKWLGFNLPKEKIEPLLTEDFQVLPDLALVSSRIEIKSIDDIQKLGEIITIAINNEIQSDQRNLSKASSESSRILKFGT